jgi:protein-disulfide isomerase
MLKKSIIALSLLSTILMADNKAIDNKVLSFTQDMISTSLKAMGKLEQINLKSIELIEKKALHEKSNWNVYKVAISIESKDGAMKDKIEQFVFSDGVYFANDLTNMEKMMTYNQMQAQKERELHSKNYTLDKKYYRAENLLYGSKDAKNKVVIFSDPMCPACISRVPAILQQLKNKEGLAVYYYHFPLNIHPTATIASIIMEKATADGVKDVHEKIYLGDLRNYMNVNKNTEPSIALAAVNSILKTSYKLSDIDSQDLKNRIMADVSAAVANKINGTPTIIYNGKKDNLRALQAYLKATK